MAEEDKGDDLPTLVCNRFYVRCYDEIVRVAFGEGVSGCRPNFHSAIRMTREDAEELVRVLGALLRQTADQGSNVTVQ